METFVTEQFGEATSVTEAVQSVTAVSTRQRKVLSRAVAAVPIYRAVTSLGFGVTGVLEMVQ
jgi:hypothetical protein